jgi:hypothetical protein
MKCRFLTITFLTQQKFADFDAFNLGEENAAPSFPQATIVPVSDSADDDDPFGVFSAKPPPSQKEEAKVRISETEIVIF